jgi:hypothetical protein
MPEKNHFSSFSTIFRDFHGLNKSFIWPDPIRPPDRHELFKKSYPKTNWNHWSKHLNLEVTASKQFKAAQVSLNFKLNKLLKVMPFRWGSLQMGDRYVEQERTVKCVVYKVTWSSFGRCWVLWNCLTTSLLQRAFKRCSIVTGKLIINLSHSLFLLTLFKNMIVNHIQYFIGDSLCW